jgi:DNA-binding PucR family transcriptional regulator
VLYRRARIEEILGRSLEDPGERLLLTLAVRLHRRPKE